MSSKNTSWGGVAKWYDKKVGESGHFYHESLILPVVRELLPKNKKIRVLDIGCGQGVLERTLSPEIDYIGVDISGELITQAKRMTKRESGVFIVSDASKPLNIRGEFDVALSVLALQNMENFKGVFDNFAKYVQVGGKVILVLNHPYFRIPRNSGWELLHGNNKQIRWVSSYLHEQKIPINMTPGQRQRSRRQVTWSFHVPLSMYVNELAKRGFAVTELEELASPKESVGRFADRENVARAEIPMFMVLVAEKLK